MGSVWPTTAILLSGQSAWLIVEAFFLSRCKRTVTIDYSLRSVCGE